jgi:hypothetical protein
VGYGTRVFGTSEVLISLSELVSCVPPEQGLNLEAGDESNWSQRVLRHKQGSEIALIEKDPVSPGSLGEAEIAEFVDEVRDEKPASAARWLSEFLPRVRVLYALQLLSGTEVADGWTGVRAIQGRLRNKWRNTPGGHGRIFE